MSELVHRRFDELLVLVHSKNPPTDAEWAEILRLNREFPDAQTLVITEGGGPTNQQRMAMNQLIKDNARSPRVAVVTAALVVRGIVSAMSWFNPNIKAFGPDHLDRAFEYLSISAARKGLLSKMIETMKQELYTGKAAV